MDEAAAKARFRACLEEFDEGLDESLEQIYVMRTRIRQVRRRIDEGNTLSPVVYPVPLLRDLGQMVEGLLSAGSALRTSQIHLLYAEGMTPEALADLFALPLRRVESILQKSP